MFDPIKYTSASSCSPSESLGAAGAASVAARGRRGRCGQLGRRSEPMAATGRLASRLPPPGVLALTIAASGCAALLEWLRADCAPAVVELRRLATKRAHHIQA